MTRMDIQLMDGLAYDKWNKSLYTGEVIEYHFNGVRKYRGKYTNGCLVQITGWFETGVMMYQYTYANNNRLGA
jgi:antitoxin component YwqK of YwqJK toxin-antitoxin module